MEEGRQSILSGDVEQLRFMMQTLEEREELKEKLKLLAADKKKAEAEWKRLQEKQEAETKRELEQAMQVATAEEDKVLKEQEKLYRDISHKRERAKNQGVRSRMEQETRDYVDLNRELDKKIRKMIKENDFPLICNTKAYFIMYSPENIKEWIIRIAVLLLMLTVLPALIVWFNQPWWLWKILIWIVTDFVVLAVYITIYLLSKDKDVGDLEQIRDLREKIDENKRKIKRIKLDIRQDTDESAYGLDSFDTELKQAEDAVAAAREKKEEKRKRFRETTEEVVIQQVAKAYREELQNTETQLDNVTKEYDEVNLKLGEKNSFIMDNYEKEVEPSVLNKDKLQKLLAVMEMGQAATIGEALQMDTK